MRASDHDLLCVMLASMCLFFNVSCVQTLPFNRHSFVHDHKIPKSARVMLPFCYNIALPLRLRCVIMIIIIIVCIERRAL